VHARADACEIILIAARLTKEKATHEHTGIFQGERVLLQISPCVGVLVQVVTSASSFQSAEHVGASQNHPTHARIFDPHQHQTHQTSYFPV